MQKKVYVERGQSHMFMAKTYMGLAEIFLIRENIPEAKIHLEKATSVLEKIKMTKTITMGELYAIDALVKAKDGTDLKEVKEAFEKAKQTIRNAISGENQDHSWKRNSNIPTINASLAEIEIIQ